MSPDTCVSRQRFLIVFDFDHSLVDEDSDRWVVNNLSPPELVAKFWENIGVMQFTDLMDLIVHETQIIKNCNAAHISDVLKTLPMHIKMIESLAKIKKTTEAKIIILSDANDFFIKSVLRHYGIEEHIDAIISNYGVVNDADGRLRIRRYRTLENPHSCPNCNPNLCKGTGHIPATIIIMIARH